MLEQSVLLLDAVPGLLGSNLGVVPDLFGEVSEVGVSGDQVLELLVLPDPGLAHDKDVVTASKGISEHGNGLEDDLRVLGLSLVAAGTVKVPLGKVLNLLNLLGEGAGLGAKGDARSVDPDVLGDDGAKLGKVEKGLGVLIVEVLHCGK